MYQKNNSELLKHFDFLVLDVLVLQLCYFQSLCMFGYRTHWGRNHFGMAAVVLLAASLIVVFSIEPYKDILKRGWYREFTQTLRLTVLISLVVVFFIFLDKELIKVPRRITVTTMLFFFPYSYIVHQVWKHFVKMRVAKKAVLRSMIVFTDADHVMEVLKNLEEIPLQDYTITKVFLMDYQTREKSKYEAMDKRITGNARDMINYALYDWVDEVFIYLPGHQNDIMWVYRDFADMGITIHDAIGEMRESSARQIPEKLGGYMVATTAINIVPTSYLILKRVVDIIGGLIGCLITGILYLFVAPAIRRADPGPVFYSQIRIGKNGKRFKMYKFRSMYQDADRRKAELMKQNEMKDDLMFKIKDDPRIIGSEKKDKNGNPKGIGNFIRRTSIDEFPQFWNVLKGDMSLVGVRPPLVSEWEKYELHHRARMTGRPGITGLWQVSGRSDIKDFESVVDLDLDYLQNWSPGLDIKILFKTVALIFTHKGAS